MHSDKNRETIRAVDYNDEVDLNESFQSNFKTTAQCIAMITPIALMTTYGISIGYTTVLISKLYKNDTEVVVTLDELTWIDKYFHFYAFVVLAKVLGRNLRSIDGSMNNFLIPLGALTAGPLLDRLGRRSLMLLSSAIYISAWMVFYGLSTSTWALLMGFALTGLSGGMIDPSCQTYASEITDPRFRGAMATSLTVAICIGVVFQIFVDMYVNWRTLPLINVFLPILAIIGTFLAPESPHWLSSKGRVKEAEKSLRWLRGWTDSISVKPEYNTLLQSSSPTSKRNPPSTPLMTLRKLYIRREFLLPFALVCFCFFLSSFNGTISVTTYAVLVFEKLESPIDEHTATLILTIVQLVAAILLMLAIHRAGKRRVTLLSLIGTSFVLFVLTLYVFLKDLKIIQKEISHSWVPMTLMLLSVFISSMGISCTPWYIAGEMFPVEVKGVAVGMLIASGNVFSALANKSFLYKLESFTLSGAFLFFVLINVFGFVVLYWTLPETEGKTFTEIKKYFVKKNNTINRVDMNSK